MGRMTSRVIRPLLDRPSMGQHIPLDLNPSQTIEIDGAIVARGLDMALADFQELMECRKITMLCERGTGEDVGLYRATFYHEGRRMRLIVDGDGNPAA